MRAGERRVDGKAFCRALEPGAHAGPTRKAAPSSGGFSTSGFSPWSGNCLQGWAGGSLCVQLFPRHASAASCPLCLCPAVPRRGGVQQAAALGPAAHTEPLAARGGAHQAAAALHGLFPAAAVQGLHAGAGHRQPGAGEAAPRLAGSHHRAAPEGTGEEGSAHGAGRDRGHFLLSAPALRDSRGFAIPCCQWLPAVVLVWGWLGLSLEGQL